MKKILFINNDIDTMSLLKTWLERKKYQVKFTESKNEIPIVKDFVPDVLLVDVLQQAALKDLKTYKETSLAPVILMTGYTKRIEDLLLPGVEDTIEKPFQYLYVRKENRNIK